MISAARRHAFTSRRWGWDKPDGGLLANARSETLHTKPFFARHADFRRCLIPADGFYENQRRTHTTSRWLFTRRREPFLGLAGLMNQEESVVVLTTAPNACVRNIHNRMPVLLPREAFAAWLDPHVPYLTLAQEFCRPWPADDLTARPLGPAEPFQLDLF